MKFVIGPIRLCDSENRFLDEWLDDTVVDKLGKPAMLVPYYQQLPPVPQLAGYPTTISIELSIYH